VCDGSEHCRHWFFRGQLIVDGVETEQTLLKMVMSTQRHSNNNNVIKFSDNSRSTDCCLLKVLGHMPSEMSWIFSSFSRLWKTPKITMVLESIRN